MAITVKDLSGVKTASVSLSSDLSVKLREDILSGKIRKGSKLTEQAICNEYKVSRTPVREALVHLEKEGLIEMIPNRGAFVSGLSAQDIEDIYTLREIYEIQATEWAIERITEDEMDELEENFEFMEFYTMKKDAKKMLNINTNFHQMIYKASHNRMLIQLLSTFQIYVKHSRRFDSTDDNYLEKVLEEHRLIFQAFKNKDAAAGKEAMLSHMEKSKKRSMSS